MRAAFVASQIDPIAQLPRVEPHSPVRAGRAAEGAHRRQNIGTAALKRAEGSIDASVNDLDRGDVELAFADSESVYVAYRGADRLSLLRGGAAHVLGAAVPQPPSDVAPHLRHV